MPVGVSLTGRHPTIANLWVRETERETSAISGFANLILTGFIKGTPDSTANTYEHGCILTQIDSGTGMPAIWQNIGSAGTPNWSLMQTGGSAQTHPITAAINSTATATAAQIATGYITSTSAAGTTITLPTGTLLGTALGAVQGTIFQFYVDNTAGANTVTIAVATNGILSAAAAAGSTANFGLLTVPSGVTGLAEFTVMFSSATAYVFSRTA